MNDAKKTKSVETLVIGGGQAGLAAGYHLARRGLPFLILDANLHIGDAWRNRWDSLRLFTPNRYNSLPGLRFPGPGDAFPTKDAMADYLETYARHFRLPMQTGVKVERLAREGGRFAITAGLMRFEAEHVIVAMSNYQRPRLPGFAKDLAPHVWQMHAHNYRNSQQLQSGRTLIVGVGNSGADISMDVARTHQTWLAGKESGHIPYRTDGFMGRFVMVRIMRFVGHHILSLGTPVGRKARPKLLHRTPPLIRVKPSDLDRAGIQRVARVVGVRNGMPLLEDGRTLEVENVIWCTGYDPGYSWIDIPVFDEQGDPVHQRGVAAIDGLYFLGLQFLYSMTSATVTGVGRDAAYVVQNIASRVQSRSKNPRLVQAADAA
ncbi:MAG: NAD(P)/FAD-dependent oxidoreductase [Acidobacteriia bacterium]|nr:NAD(P)/FAD-dependent oxidoreductase [Terriglobia bacterium]